MKLLIKSAFCLSMAGLTACGIFDDDFDPGRAKGGKLPSQASPLALAGGLRTFESCSAVEAYIEKQLIDEQDRQLTQSLQNLKGYADSDRKSVQNMDAPSATGDAANSAAPESAGPSEHTTTNNQVAGVEEGDFVKNTGTHLYQITGQQLQVVRTWPANDMKLVKTVKLEVPARQLMLDEENKQLVIITQGCSGYWNGHCGTYADVGVMGAEDEAVDVASQQRMAQQQGATVLVYSLQDPESPEFVAEVALPGNFRDARRSGDGLRVITSQDGHSWLGLDYLHDYRQPRETYADVEARVQRKHAKNVALIRAQPLEKWLQLDGWRKRTPEGDSERIVDIGDCGAIHGPLPELSLHHGLTIISSIDLATMAASQQMMLAYTSEMYANSKALYLTTPYYWWNYQSRDTDHTYIHKFEYVNDATAAYVGTGSVPGLLVNQFAMDEYDGDLRVASTLNPWNWWRGSMEGDADSEEPRQYSLVSVLRPENGKLATIGKTKPLAPDERIYSARFVGKMGYVVTFRQVDPLFTLDLSNPEQPEVVGELKIPGFSTYIHPMGNGYLLTIGKEATEEGRVIGLKLSIFDVRDPANPQEVQKLVLSGNIWSNAEYEHKAFTYFASRGLLAIPATGYFPSSGGDWWSGYRSMLMVFSVDPEAGIKAKGELDMSNVYAGNPRDYGWWSQRAYVSRSIFADDYVYAISQLGVRSARVSELPESLSTARYPCDDYCNNYWY